jgi:lipopolysaccharide export system permease protein
MLGRGRNPDPARVETMSILSRYILRQFIKPFFASFLALCLIIFVSQIFDRLDRFLANGVSFMHVLGFLITLMPYQALQILPVASLLGTLFVVGNLIRNKEYVAGLAGGLAPEKFLKGLLLAGFVISLTALISNETFIPPATHYARSLFRDKIRHLGAMSTTVYSDLTVAGSDGRLWSISTLNTDTGRLGRVWVDTYADGRIAFQIDASSAQRTDNGWIFYNGVVRTFTDNSLEIAAIEPFSNRLFAFSEKPDDFIIQEPEPEEMTYNQLKRRLRHLEALGVRARSLEVELKMKLAFPFTCLVVIFLGVPLSLQGKGNAALGIAAGGLITLVYLGFTQFGKALAQRLVEPWVGAWLGNIVFTLIGLYLWYRMRKTA